MNSFEAKGNHEINTKKLRDLNRSCPELRASVLPMSYVINFLVFVKPLVSPTKHFSTQ